MRNEIENILLQIKESENNPEKDCVLPQNAYYLNEDTIVCRDRNFGVSRYPYDSDGLVLWAYSNGIIEACESTFNIFKPKHFCEEPSINFFGGILNSDGLYTPVALFDTSKQLIENGIDRYVVYSNRCVYYISDTEKVTFCLRIHTDENKHMHFSFNAFNKTDKNVSIYMLSMFEAILRYKEDEMFWDKMTKFSNRYDNDYILKSNSDCLTVKKEIIGGKITDEFHTAAKSDIIGGRKSVINANCLLSGKFMNEHDAMNTVDLPVAADILNAEIEANGNIRCEYDLSYYHSVEEAETALKEKIDTNSIDKALSLWADTEKQEFDNLKISFEDWNGNIEAGLLNKFLRSVQKQVSFCALGKNYAGHLIGIRDVMQQLEGSLIWQPQKSRQKILNALNYILEDGRPPRQFSVPDNDNVMPEMDLREFIDQGVWIISTVYSYLSFTDDYSILDEKCSYYVVDEDNTYITRKSDIYDTVLEHLIKIMAFLSSNLDYEYGTNCLRALYGDWNDAINGLGRTDNPDKKFGSGVSVMASLQFYRNCQEMIGILGKTKKFQEKIPEYQMYRDNIEKGLLKYAIDTDNAGNRRIIHGWGDNYSYKVGSFNDPDGVSRLSSTANSFWAISGMIEKDKSLKSVIKKTFDELNSKYGLLTFDKPFGPDIEREVGRISGITKGTYENCASYVHAAMFAGMALFAIGESQKAWAELEKSIVISHGNCSMTPFVMPNSYCSNAELGIDGESMGDWYTGSGTVLIKEIVKYGFGINPDLDGIKISMPRVMPCKNAEISIMIKGKVLKIKYSNNGNINRSFSIDGILRETLYDDISEISVIYLSANDLKNNMTIEICD